MLLFDLTATQAIGRVKRHGGGIYGEIVFRRMVERGVEFMCYYDSRRWLNPEIQNIILKNKIRVFDIQKYELCDIVKNNNVTTVYSPMVGNSFETIDCRKIVTIHGLRRFELQTDRNKLKYPYSRKELIKEIITRALPGILIKREYKSYRNRYFSDDKLEIITVSNHSKNALRCFFNEVNNNDVKISVMYSPSTTLINDTSPINPIGTDFLLMVSGNRWDKNSLRGIEAFERLKSKGFLKDIKLIVTGTSEYGYKYKFNYPNDVILKDYVSDEELEKLYHHAKVFVYPSLNEGFGYPPLEAMKYGTPVVASAVTSIPEICGDGAVYFNPWSVEEIMNRILQLVCNDNFYNEMSEKAVSRYELVTQKQKVDLDRLIDYIIK